jgi:hypothetical protein
MHAQSESLRQQYEKNPDRDFVEIISTTLNPAKEVVKNYIKISGSGGKTVIN